MTDDRARRIRNLRKRTSDRGDAEAEPAGTDEQDDPDADDEEASEPSTDEPVKTDGNGEGAETSDGAADGSTDETDDSSTSENTDDSPTSDAPDDVELEYSSDADATDGESADADAANVDETDAVPTATESTVAATDEESGGDSDESAASAGDADHDAVSADEGDGSATPEPAETTVAAATETAAVASPGASAETGAGLKPMVETATVSDSPFGGAIASEDVLADFVDDVGTGETDAIGAGTAGRSASVFDRDDSLVATTHEDDTIQMLEFYLNDDRYAIEIARISAIVEMKRITRFPRGPEAIDGVTDLRGEITAVLDPTAMLDVERSELSDDQYIVVLERDDDKQKLGIRVTDVLQAVTYRESQIDETASVMDAAGDHAHEFVHGIVKKTTDGRTELVTWLDVDSIIENTE